ncbi:uncharacterized protein LOC144444761 isoform X1 [Glandiceps talaboti]
MLVISVLVGIVNLIVSLIFRIVCWPGKEESKIECVQGSYKISVDGSDNKVIDLSNAVISQSIVHICCDGKRIDVQSNPLLDVLNCTENIDDGTKDPTIKSTKVDKPSATRLRKKRVTKRECRGITVPQKMPLIKRTSICTSRGYVTLVRKLSDLQMAGMWEEVDRTCSELSLRLAESATTDIQIVMLSYRANAACLHLDTSKAVSLVESAQSLLGQAENRQLLEARLLFMMGYAYRKEKLLGKAQSCLQSALQIFQGIEPCAFHGVCLYSMACIKYDLVSRQANPPDGLFQEIITDLERAIDYHYYDDPGITFYVRQRTVVKMANILIDCDSHMGRTREIPAADVRVEKARRLLQNLESDLEADHTGHLLGYSECFLLQGKANCCLRLKQYSEAERLAVNALDIANENGFKAEITAIEQLLDDITPHVKHRELLHCSDLDKLAEAFSDGNIADYSSNADYDD